MSADPRKAAVFCAAQQIGASARTKLRDRSRATSSAFTSDREALQVSPEPVDTERKLMAPKKARKKKIAAKRQAWNKGLELGKRDAFTPDQVKRIRGLLVKRGVSGLRDLALFSTGIDTMLQGHHLLGVLVRDVQYRNGSIRSTIEVSQKRGGPPVRHALSQLTAKALEKWIAHSGKKANDYLFPGRGIKSRRPMSPRQLNRLVKLWVIEAELDPDVYGVDSLRRTKALHILRSTGDLQTVRALLGHARIENTARFLGLETKSDPIEVSRSFDI